MKKAIFIISILFTFFSCQDGSRFKGLILVDPNTGSKYLIKHYIGDTYFIDKQEMVIVGKDTSYVFK